MSRIAMADLAAPALHLLRLRQVYQAPAMITIWVVQNGSLTSRLLRLAGGLRTLRGARAPDMLGHQSELSITSVTHPETGTW
jgi:hypothetical protein